MEITVPIDFFFRCEKCSGVVTVEQKTVDRLTFIAVAPCQNCLIDAKIDGFRQASATAQRVLDKAFAS